MTKSQERNNAHSYSRLVIRIWSFVRHSGLVILVLQRSPLVHNFVPSSNRPGFPQRRSPHERARDARLGNLLDRAFEVNHIPPAEQESRRAVLALQALADPSRKFSADQRQQLLSKVATGIEQALPAMRDPEVLLQQATVLIDQGVSHDVNTLEYWGDNLTVMSQLRPIAAGRRRDLRPRRPTCRRSGQRRHRSPHPTAR